MQRDDRKHGYPVPPGVSNAPGTDAEPLRRGGRDSPESPPSISIVMPARNAAAHLLRAVSSVQAQTREDWELIIADDGSTDGTLDLARDLAAHDPRIRPLAPPDSGQRGAAKARNRAIAAARGRYLGFLDADDEWLPEKLARQLGWMEKQGLAITFTGFWRQRAEQRHEVKVPARVTRRQLLRGNVIGGLTVICDREKLAPVEVPALRLRQDYALWLDLLSRTEAAHGLQEPLAIYHVTPGSLSSNRWRATQATWRMYRDHAGLGRVAATWCLASHVIRRLLRG